MVDGDASSGGDLALVGTFFVVVLVGTFASQVRLSHTPTHPGVLIYLLFVGERMTGVIDRYSGNPSLRK